MGNRQEAGFVSLFTVIFFMMLITVLTVGFLRIMGIEQKQSTDNDLSASALAAADSGIEDGKRIILKYTQMADTDPNKAVLRTAMNSTNCGALSATPYLQSQLNIDPAGNIVGNPALNQYYTCLNIQLNTDDYTSHSAAGASKYIPLRTTNNAQFARFKVSWHLLSDTIDDNGDGKINGYSPAPVLPPVVNVNGNPSNSWSSYKYPAFLRLQVYGYPAGNLIRTDLDNRSRSLFLIPSNIGADSTTALVPFNGDVRGMSQNKTILNQVRCDPDHASDAKEGSYACSAIMEMPTGGGLNGANNTYFLRVTPLYGQTHFKIEPLDGSNSPIQFSEVQPIIDTTGRAADVFRRIQARVQLNPASDFPEFVVESADDICKTIRVTNDPAHYLPNQCN